MNLIRKKRTTVISIIVIFTVLLLTGCETFNNFRAMFVETEEDHDAVIRIGVFQPLSGPHQRYGDLERRGIELAHELFPTVLGKNVELVFADNRSDIHIAEVAIQNLIDRNPVIVLGSYGEIFSLIGAEFLEEAEIPAIAISNTNWLVTSNNPFYFRVRFVESFEGIAVARFAVEEMNVSSVAIFQPANDDAAMAVSQAFGDTIVRLTENPDAVVSSQDFDPAGEDFRHQLRMIMFSGAEVVFMPSNIEIAAEILKQAEEVGLQATFLGISTWDNPELIELAGEAAEGIAFSTIFDPHAGITEMTEVFLNAYREKYGEDEIPHQSVALAFDAYLGALDAIERAGRVDMNRLTLLRLADTTDFHGATGSISFDSNGDPIKTVIIMTVRRGEIIATYAVDPEIEDDNYDDIMY
jgi:branched-chain amino acid transport system substrate-binding protein